MKICEIEFASSSIAFSMQIINELELNLFSLEFNYLKTTSVELNSVKTSSRKLNSPQTPDLSKFNFPRSRAAVAQRTQNHHQQRASPTSARGTCTTPGSRSCHAWQCVRFSLRATAGTSVLSYWFLDLGSFLHVFNLAELSFPELKDGIQERA